MSANNGGPAFPQIYWDDAGKQYLHGTGMTLRDYFAAKAMQWMLAAGEGVPNEKLSKWAYDVADAMLAERAQGGAA